MINSRNKGNTFERKICKQLTDALGTEFIRTPHSGAFATIHKKVESIQDMQSDITYDRSKLDWFKVIECKHYKTIRMYPDLWNPKSELRGWIATLEVIAPDNDWVLIFQQNRSEPMALAPQMMKALVNMCTIGGVENITPHGQPIASPFTGYGMYIIVTLDQLIQASKAELVRKADRAEKKAAYEKKMMDPAYKKLQEHMYSPVNTDESVRV